MPSVTSPKTSFSSIVKKLFRVVKKIKRNYFPLFKVFLLYLNLQDDQIFFSLSVYRKLGKHTNLKFNTQVSLQVDLGVKCKFLGSSVHL